MISTKFWIANPNHRASVDPALARTLEKGLVRSWANTNLRLIWHKIYDFCPELLKQCNGKDSEFMDQFLSEKSGSSSGLDFKIHIDILAWLSRSSFSLDISAPLVEELLAATAANWLRTSLGEPTGIMLCSKHMGNLGIMGIKSRNPMSSHTVAKIKCSINCQELVQAWLLYGDDFTMGHQMEILLR